MVCFLEFDVPDKIEDDVTLLGDIAFNNVQLRPQIAIDREEKKDKKAVKGEQNETQGDEGAKQNMKSED